MTKRLMLLQLHNSDRDHHQTIMNRVAIISISIKPWTDYKQPPYPPSVFKPTDCPSHRVGRWMR